MATKNLNTKKLKEIEEIAFKMGNKAAKGFNEDLNIASLKAAVTAYRCSMQAIRDQIKFKISN